MLNTEDFELTIPEATLIVDALNGVGLAGEFTLVANLKYPIYSERLDWKWRVDGPALIRRIEDWSPEKRAALIEAVETYWAPGDISDTTAGLLAAGLISSRFHFIVVQPPQWPRPEGLAMWRRLGANFALRAMALVAWDWLTGRWLSAPDLVAPMLFGDQAGHTREISRAEAVRIAASLDIMPVPTDEEAMALVEGR